MRICKMKDTIQGPINGELTHIGYWPPSTTSSNSVPLYHVKSSQEFNQIIGHAKFINGSNGTVLYRGQNTNHPSLLPSGARNGYNPVSDSIIDAICNDSDIKRFMKLENDGIKGLDWYQKVIIESALQHYGANTYCMDFVDNHWCALWFGLHKFENNQYIRRSGVDEKLYVYLYLADTNGTCIRGMYIGEDTYTVDLRKAIPSYFSRPSSQHGWIVRKHKREKCDYNDRVICVLEIDVEDASNWLGAGELLSQTNFFPSFSRDQGYHVLLSRQQRSGLPSGKSKLLPIKTICNYHYTDTYYSSDHTANPPPLFTVTTTNNETITSIPKLYSLLLENGWSKETCEDDYLWSEDNPANGQSAVTSLLVQKYFGGEILHYKYSNRPHYFNRINGCIYDLTFNELHISTKKIYPPAKYDDLGSSPKRTTRKNASKLRILIDNCGINDT